MMFLKCLWGLLILSSLRCLLVFGFISKNIAHYRKQAQTIHFGSIFRIREKFGNFFQKSTPEETIGIESEIISEYDDTPTVLTDDICLLPGEPVVRIELAPQNARRIFTGIDIFADVDSVWKVLTDYEKLHLVVPSLIKNEVLEKYSDGGAKLYQVGGANVLPGITFKASVTLDIRTFLETNPIPDDRLHSNLPGNATATQIIAFKNLPLQRDVFPRPYALTTLPHRDITMQNILGEGDFDHYQGVWRMQRLPNCAPNGGDATRLTYAVEIRPKGFLPVALIEKRVASDLQANLEAIRTFVESKYSSSLSNAYESDIFERNMRTDSIDDMGKISNLVTEVRDLRRRVEILESELRAKQKLVDSIVSVIANSLKTTEA